MVPSTIELKQQRTAALTAGIALIVMTLAAFFSYGFVHESLLVQGDASLTFQAVTSSRNLFKAENGCFGDRPAEFNRGAAAFRPCRLFILS
ncbi:hypothetical protein ABH899_003101 [Paenibacillus sp. RC84]